MLAGCDGAGTANPVIEGPYAARFIYHADNTIFETQWSLTLTSDGSTLTGEGMLGATPVSVQGHHIGREVRLDFFDGSVNTPAGTFEGWVSQNGAVLEGIYNRPLLFVGVPVALRREE